MRSFISTLILLFILTSNIFSQVNYYYYPISSGTTNDLSFINNMNFSGCFITGTNSTLLRSTNTGATIWNPLSIGTTNLNLNGILLKYNYSGSGGFIFGNNGIIYTTTNFGLNWSEQKSQVTKNLYAGSILIADVIPNYKYIIVGANGTIVYRRVFPDTLYWSSITGVTTNDLKSVYVVNGTGWIAGSNGTLLKSTNYGLNWNPVQSGVSNDLNSIFFINSLNGIAVGSNGIILRTTNGGQNWISVQGGTTQTLNQIINSGSTDSTNFWIMGNNGTVLKSTNAGQNWELQGYVPSKNFYSGFYMFGSLYIVGQNGSIYRRLLDTSYHYYNSHNLNGNNISSYFNISGIFDQNKQFQNIAGFEWPKGTSKTAIFTAGLSIGAFVNGQLREAMCSYGGEYDSGYCVNGNYITNSNFKFYKVSRGDNAQNNTDWANWGQMIPFGAPFIDVNLNGVYEPAIDTPGVHNAKQTIFYCMTDANPNSHNSNEGFGGGTLPLGAEVHLTAWVYDNMGLEDVQFIQFDVINKSLNTWNAVKMGIVSDPDLGYAIDDYIGCDTTLNLGFCYNGDNYDEVYGNNPPAVGFTLLRGPLNRSVTPNIRLGLTSFSYFQYGNVPCETDPYGQPYPAYLMLGGFKKDSTCWLDPTQNPPKKTKFCYSGDPETNIGWTEVKGSIWNCGHDSTGFVNYPNSPGDRRLIMGSGANNFNIVPGESQKFVIAQLISRDSGNLKSVTKLKQLTNYVRNFYEQNFPIGINQISSSVPDKFYLAQNYPNPFNPSTTIKYEIPNDFSPLTKGGLRGVSLKVFDLLGREIITLVNEFQSPGTYEVTFDGSSYASGIYFYKLTVGDFTAVKKMILIK